MSNNKQIILIGGAPTTGKSTIANMLSKHLGVPWISTDQIRQIMRSVANRNDYLELFNPEGYDTAEKFHSEFSPEQIVEMEISQWKITWIGIKGFIEDAYPWTGSYIIEGSGILPSFVYDNFKDDLKIRPIFLIDEDTNRLRNVIFNRGLFGAAKSYSDEVKEKEVEWVKLFSEKIKEEAIACGYPLVEISKNDDDWEKILKILNS